MTSRKYPPEYLCNAWLFRENRRCYKPRQAYSHYCTRHQNYTTPIGAPQVPQAPDLKAREEDRKMNKREELEAQVRAAAGVMTSAQLELERLDELPAEPVSPFEDGTLVVFFRKQFAAYGPYYSYTCTKVTMSTGKGFWYISGSNALARRPWQWEELMQWLTAGERWELWLCNGMIPIDSSESEGAGE
jgi:hypothetical protein